MPVSLSLSNYCGGAREARVTCLADSREPCEERRETETVQFYEHLFYFGGFDRGRVPGQDYTKRSNGPLFLSYLGLSQHYFGGLNLLYLLYIFIYVIDIHSKTSCSQTLIRVFPFVPTNYIKC